MRTSARALEARSLALGIAAASLGFLGGCGGSTSGGAPDGSNPETICGGIEQLATPVPDEGGAGSCTFALGALPSVNVSNNCIDIFVGGSKAPHDPLDADGWDYADASHTVIQLGGAACATARAAPSPAVLVVYSCCGIA